MSKDLKVLHKKRSTFVRKIKNIRNFVDNINPDEIDELETRLEDFETEFKSFKSLQAEIEILNPTVEEFDKSENIENDYFKIASKIKKIIKAQASNDTKPIVATNINQSAVKLPSVNIPEFSGKYSEYIQFKNSFDALIDSNESLSAIQKFYYLKSVLKGEASELIHNLTVTADNYHLARTLLQDRFENKKIIVNSHITEIFNCPNLTKESLTDLRGLLNRFTKNYRALQKLDENLQNSNSIIVYLLASKLDITTKRAWESTLTTQALPQIDDLLSFILNRCQILENLQPITIQKNDKPQKTLAHISNNSKGKCPVCKGDHFIYFCDQLKSLNIKDRLAKVKTVKLCTNCLRDNHTTKECKASGCKICGKSHNTLLHINQDESNSMPQSSAHISQYSGNKLYKNTLLSTAVIFIEANDKRLIKCRVLLDSGSQSNFITNELFSKLNVGCKNINVPVVGIGGGTSYISKQTEAIIQSTNSKFRTRIKFLIIKKITENLPSRSFSKETIPIPKHIHLADPDFNISAKIDILLGISTFYDLLDYKKISLNRNLPVLQGTKLGWILGGNLVIDEKYNKCSSMHVSNKELNEQLKTFWEVEEIAPIDMKTADHKIVESYFKKTTTRDNDGRFVVSLPTRDNIHKLGNNQENAINRFLSLERKLQKNMNLKIEYSKFIVEFLELGHMSRLAPEEVDVLKGSYYLPHHCVLKNSSITTKLRVVFDASSKDENGLSLNDVLIPGPNIQQDLFSILLRFRKYRIAFTADVTKMYRQIKIRKEQHCLQRIVWRFNSNEPIQHFKINRLTYGTSPASFLATRVLREVALISAQTHPDVSRRISTDFYMDDLLSGADSIDDAKRLVQQIGNILQSAGFSLRKWISNNKNIFNNNEITNNLQNHYILDTSTIKTLGVSWNAQLDQLEYICDLNETTDLSKRGILSWVSRVFDPLGLLTPITIIAKIMIQELWRLEIGWDQNLPQNILCKWKSTLEQLRKINNNVPRCIMILKPVHISIMGFCDASEKAYGACLYLVTKNESGHIMSRLMCAKSRVAPLKTISLPRLELCGAVLLARLTNKVLSIMDLNITEVTLWTDSKIVLAWLNSEPADLKTFVANRVSEIQTTTEKFIWTHVKSKDNPADLISRGTTVEGLQSNKLWWQGPEWILNSIPFVKNQIELDFEIPERKTKLVHVLMTVDDPTNWMERFSSFNMLLRVTAYILRFFKNCTNSKEKIIGELKIEEINCARQTIMKIVQNSVFKAEISTINKGSALPSSSKLIKLNPKIDENGMLRIGGRLSHAIIPYEQRHPIIIPKNHHITNLIIQDCHQRLFHAGARLTLSIIRESYWPIDGLSCTKGIIRKCVKCFRKQPKTINQLMGELPSFRVTPSKPFTNVGVDLAGPYLLKDGKLRNRTLTKAYIVLFICFSSKAIHLELASELTTHSFLNALKRFVARRGLCRNIFSDNGTNFVGTKNYLNDLYQNLNNIVSDNAIRAYLLNNKIQWHFNPVKSPSFGGLWERAIGSVKSHLRLILNDIRLTFESFYTILVQIEAILNSRPLYPLSDDPNDIDPLTPAHFLIGSSMEAIPEPDNREIKTNRLNHYQHLQQLINHFWSRWTKEYLNNLQMRNKWHKPPSLIKPGCLVIVKDENLPPRIWPMGRIVNVYPGKDDIVRVVDVKMKNGTFRRALNKICILPLEENTD